MARNPVAPSTTLKIALDDYLDWHALRGSSKRHRGDAKRMLLAFAAAVDPERPLDPVTRDDCMTFRRGIQERTEKANALKAYKKKGIDLSIAPRYTKAYA